MSKKFSRKHYNQLAEICRESDTTAQVAAKICEMLDEDAGLTQNGNRAFDVDRFMGSALPETMEWTVTEHFAGPRTVEVYLIKRPIG